MSMERKKQYYEIIVDAWTLMKDHIEKTDFDRMYVQVHDLDEKYKDTEYYQFAQDIIVGVMTEINRIHGEE